MDRLLYKAMQFLQTYWGSQHLDSSPAKFLPGIQYLRGFAALYVVAYHINGDFDFSLFRYGYLGVQLFFVVSGFIITHVHSKKSGFEQMKTFFWRRLIRIYPTYWAALLPVILLFLMLPDKGLAWHRDPMNIMRNLLLIQNVHQSILGVAWSLIYEIMFYTVFGLCVIGLAIPLKWLLVGWALLLAIAHYFAQSLTTEWIFLNSYNAYFLAGCTLALIYPYLRVRRLSSTHFLALILLFLAVPFMNDSFWVIFLTSVLLCMAAILYESSQPSQFYMLLGNASYSIYLIHLTIIAIVTTLITGVWVMVPLFLICLVSGIAFYYGVEKSLQKWLRESVPKPTLSR